METIIDYKEIGTIDDEIEQMRLALIDEKLDRDSLEEIANEIEEALKQEIGRSDRKTSSVKSAKDGLFDTTTYVHMQDDIIHYIKSDLNGNLTLIIKGGKDTGYKWRFLNDGTLYKGNLHIEGKHFIEKALARTTSKVDQIVKDSTRRKLENAGRKRRNRNSK